MLADDVFVYRWVGEGINICISTAETCLSYKSLAKCPEHVALHNKGITLQTTHEIGTKLKPSQRVADPVNVFSWLYHIAAVLTNVKAKHCALICCQLHTYYSHEHP